MENLRNHCQATRQVFSSLPFVLRSDNSDVSKCAGSSSDGPGDDLAVGIDSHPRGELRLYRHLYVQVYPTISLNTSRHIGTNPAFAIQSIEQLVING